MLPDFVETRPTLDSKRKSVRQVSEGGLLMEKLFELKGPRILTRAEAQRLIPVIIKMTERTQKEVQFLVQKLELVRQVDPDHAQTIENQIDDVMNIWRDQVTRLGGKPKGIWIVDFDNGQGYYCWKYPEREIKFEHGYRDGFLCRRELASKIEPAIPDKVR